jgi:aminoglycoside phosphotransferase family enzyme
LIKSLLNPQKYPDNPDNVKFVQTHISNVFISKNYVYKIKKPVNFGFLDFTTLEKRKYFCNQEIILNSRLSPDIYIKIVPVVSYNHDFFYEKYLDKGKIIDYAVVMKRINENNLLKNLLKNNFLKDDSFKLISSTLYSFHEKYPASLEDAYENSSIKMLKFTTDENFSQTEKYIGTTISESQFKNIKNFTNKFYIKEEKLLNKRIKELKIKECHGDLHLEHIGIENNQPFFIDCIEFNKRFRIIDVANEVAFLSMDLDFNEYKELSKKFVEYYIQISEDYEILKLLNFYKIYRAYVRGKVTSFLVDDINVKNEDKNAIVNTAKKYFALAETYLDEL